MTDRKYRKQYGPWSIVIGASMGIGAACAKRLASKGINVIVTARSVGKLDELVEEIKAEYGVDAKAIALDILKDDAYEVIDRETKDLELGSAVFSAAYCIDGAFLQYSEEEYRKMVELNVWGPYRFAKYFGERFCQQKRGGLLFLSSLGGYYGAAGQAMYGGTKAFEIALAEGLNSEFSLYNVDVTVALIGAVATPGLIDMFGEDGVKKLSAADEVQVGNECIDGLGKPVVTITQPMKAAVAMMRHVMPLNTQVKVTGSSNIKINCGGNLDQFSSEKHNARLGQKLAEDHPTK